MEGGVVNAELWSAVTCHRFPALATRRQSRAAFSGPRISWCIAVAFEGDKPPAESGVKPPHSIACGENFIHLDYEH
jgi:hypothetical protein